MAETNLNVVTASKLEECEAQLWDAMKVYFSTHEDTSNLMTIVKGYLDSANREVIGTTGTAKAQAVLNSVNAIVAAFEQIGVSMTGKKLSEFAALIKRKTVAYNIEIEYAELDAGGGETNYVAYSDCCGILDEDDVEWDLKEWNDRWVENGYSITGLSKPVGIWFRVDNRHFALLWRYADTRYELTGTASSVAGMQHSQNAFSQVTTANSGNYYPAAQGTIGHAAGNYRSAAWERSVVNGMCQLYSGNTGRSFLIGLNTAENGTTPFLENNTERTTALINYNEWLRDLSAICSGVATDEENGTVSEVRILNSSGAQPAAGEDMYFWVKDTSDTYVNTGLLAKYNLNSGLTAAYLLTTAIRDSIYNKQKQNGVNMNDTGVNSASKKVLVPGATGAKAVAVDGYWFISTPYISQPSTSFTTSNNIQDCPAALYCRSLDGDLPDAWHMFTDFVFYNTLEMGINNYLKYVEGHDAIPVMTNGNYWLAARFNSLTAWYLTVSSGGVTYTNASTRCSVRASRALS